MTDKQPFDRKLLKKGAILHFRCGGSDVVIGADGGHIDLKSGFASTWSNDGRFFADEDYPLDIIAITPAKERELLKGFVALGGMGDSYYVPDRRDFITIYNTILDLSDCYHADGTPWRVGDGK